MLLNETKSSPRIDDAQAFVRFMESDEFGLYFPQYRELPIVPAFSSLSIPQDMVTYLTRRGIYAIAMGDEAMQVLNLDAVQGLDQKCRRMRRPGCWPRRYSGSWEPLRGSRRASTGTASPSSTMSSRTTRGPGKRTSISARRC